MVEKDNQQPMRDQVITMECELILYLFVECCSHLTNTQNFWLVVLDVLAYEMTSNQPVKLLGCRGFVEF
jgi:hypothetical protein